MIYMRNIPMRLFIGLALIALASAPASAADAPELFVTYKCSLCHAVNAAGIEAKVKSEKMKGPDLGGYVATDVDTLESFIRKEAPLNEAEHKRAYEGSREELDQLLKWLAGLEKMK
jgi:mono/diheme cytochrome c family protein